MRWKPDIEKKKGRKASMVMQEREKKRVKLDGPLMALG